MADISKIKTPNNIEYNVKDAALTTEITNARGNYVNLDARLDNYDEVIGDIDTALNNLLVTLVPKTITENGTYDPADDNVDGYNEVTVDVPNTYTQVDEGKVVSNGQLVAQTSTTAITNGTIDTTTNNEVVVNVQNSYTQSDEGKVVSSGTLVAQTSATVTENGIVDTTTVSSVTVEVPTGGSWLRTLTPGVCRPSCFKWRTGKYWGSKTWNGLTSFYGDYIWTDGENIYYSNASDQYVLDKSTDTWNAKTWNGMSSFNCKNVWTDGENIYYSASSTQYVLDKPTSTWVSKTWNGLTSFYGSRIWTDGENIYHSTYSSISSPSNYILDKSTDTWSKKTFYGTTQEGYNYPSFDGSDIWTDGDKIYCSHYNSPTYVLDKKTSTWSSGGYSVSKAENVFTDGEKLYYTYYYNDSNYGIVGIGGAKPEFDAKIYGSTDKKMTDGSRIWTDGENIYYSNGTTQGVLIAATIYEPTIMPKIPAATL